MKTRVTNVLSHAVVLDHYGDKVEATDSCVLDDEIAAVRRHLKRQAAYLHLSPVVEPLDASPVAQAAALGAEAVLGALNGPSLADVFPPVAVEEEEVEPAEPPSKEAAADLAKDPAETSDEVAPAEESDET